MSYDSQLFNFIQGSDITGESSYDVWKSLNPNGTEQEFVEFLRSGPQGEKGEPAYSYGLIASDTIMKRDVNGVLVPLNIKFSAFYRTGTCATQNDYAGKFVVQETINGTDWITTYTSETNEVFIAYTPQNIEAKIVKCSLYSADDETLELDNQSVAILLDFTREEIEALTAVLTNAAHVVATDGDGNNGDYSDCNTAIQVYSGVYDVTSQCAYEVVEGEGVTGVWDNNTYTYSVSDLSVDTSHVDITATYFETTVTKRFTISKAKSGKSAYELWLEIPGNEGKSEEDFLFESKTEAEKALVEAKAYTDQQVDAIVGEGATETLDTIGELSSAIRDNKDILDLLNDSLTNKADAVDVVGATAESNGTAGLVPAPAAGDQNKYLKGDGTWGDVTTVVEAVLSDEGVLRFRSVTNIPNAEDVTF